MKKVPKKDNKLALTHLQAGKNADFEHGTKHFLLYQLLMTECL
jgi:hypothetical protein